MEHADAQERLADLALEPGRLAALDDDPSSDSEALRRHLAGCFRCAAELAAWRRTWSGLEAASSADNEVLRAPTSLRDRTVAAITEDVPAEEARAEEPRVGGRPPVRPPERRPDRATPSSEAAGTRRWVRVRPWFAVAAALAIAIGAGGLAWIRTSELEQARAESLQLASATATLDRVLADPVHWITPLSGAGGTPGGSLAWSPTEVVVIATGLGRPAPGASYRCWVERDGVRTEVGAMSFSGDVGYWAGSMTGWGSSLEPGGTFGVSHVTPDGGDPATVLVGTL